MQTQTSTPLSKVELSIECKGLTNKDVMSKSDPQCYVFIQPPRTSNWIEVGKTEMIKDNLSPKFATSISVDYYFEEVQNLKFSVVDVDKPGKGIDQQELIGNFECTLASIVGSRGSQVTKELISKHKKKAGLIIITAEEVQEMRTTISLRLSGQHLDKKDFFGKSDPFLVISKSREDGSFIKVHQTEVVMKTLDPVWKPIVINAAKLSGGDFDRPLLFECFDWNKSGQFDFIGKFQASIKQLQEKKVFDLKNPKKEKKGYVNSGTIHVDGIDLKKEHTFIDYLVGGCEISLVVAVDFTSSNGDPRYSNSLHYRNPYQPNEYEQALMSVGDILCHYDSDGNYPVYGFGGKVPWLNNQVSHCFPLNGNPQNPEVPGIPGILDAYRRNLDQVQLYGPTNFSQVISSAAFIASQHSTQEKQKYFILLILTDGEITDMDNTIEEIVKASRLPLSIIIVGVGNADFSNMNILDADDKALVSQGKKAERDIVQFVPFRDFKGQHPSLLASSTLAEVPMQFVSWMTAHNIVPNPPIPPPVYVAPPPADYTQPPPVASAPPPMP